MAQTDIQKRVNGLINEFFKDIKSHFDGDELAYLTLQGKNEQQIRDRFAWWLQKKLNEKSFFGFIKYGSGLEKYVVRREFSPEGRSKVDLAILEIDKDEEDAWDNPTNSSKPNVMDKSREMKTYKVIAMIEFKAHSFVNDEIYFYAEFNRDVIKMCDFVDVLSLNNHKEDPDLYFIFLQGMPNHRSIGYHYKVAVIYRDLLEREKLWTYSKAEETDIKAEIKKQWEKFIPYPYSFSSTAGFSRGRNVKNIVLSKNHSCNLSCPDPQPQYIGTSFGYGLYCSPMIWGPVKADDIFLGNKIVVIM